jgi:DNA-directed RNA polymerase specialized sigma24 family protein
MSRELVSISGVHWLMAGGGGTSGASSVLLDEKLHGRRAARNRMIEQNLPLARAIARRFPNGPEPVEDLVQDASIGLIRAVDGFRAERGRDLGPYAVPTIVGELRRSVRRRSWPVRVPSGRRDIEPRPVAVTLRVWSAFCASGQVSKAAMAKRSVGRSVTSSLASLTG